MGHSVLRQEPAAPLEKDHEPVIFTSPHPLRPPAGACRGSPAGAIGARAASQRRGQRPQRSSQAAQAEQLQAAISYFRLDATTHHAPANTQVKGTARRDLKKAVMAVAPHMSKTGKAKAGSGGFDLDLDDAHDDLDTEFTRRGAA
jgi:hypothetical protein